MAFLDELGAALRAHMPEETILVTGNRMEGRRLLSACAEGGILMGVRAETPATLALELCGDLFSGPSPARLMNQSECAELMRQCLIECAGELTFFSGKQGQSMAAAAEAARTLSELAFAEVPLSGTGKLDELERLARAYREKKAALRLMDRADLLHCALERDGGDFARTHFVLLGCYVPEPLELRLIDALSAGRKTVVPVPLPAAVALPRGLCGVPGAPGADLADAAADARFVRCRGREPETHFVFRDILEKNLPLDDCAVVFPSVAYAEPLLEAAGRYGVGLTMGGGIPLRTSRLYWALRRLSVWQDTDFDAEALCALLDTGALCPKQARGLSAAIRDKRIGWGAERYAYVTAGDAPDDAKQAEARADWARFLALALRAAKGEGDLEAQKRDLSALAGYRNAAVVREPLAAAAVCAVLDGIHVLFEGETLLRRALAVMERTNISAENAAAGKVFCAPLSRAMFTGRRHLYVVGLERDCFGAGGESPLLLDEERAACSERLKTAADRETERQFRFMELLLLRGGDVTLTRPDYDSANGLELAPSPLYELLREAVPERAEKQIDYIPDSPLSAGDRLVREQALAFLPGEGAALPEDTPAAALGPAQTLAEQLRDKTISPSALETALSCPLRFYYQHLLHIYPPRPPVWKDSGWLEKNTIGDFCHKVLERFFSSEHGGPAAIDTGPGRARLDAICAEELTLLRRENPPTRPELQAEDERRAREMIEEAIRWTETQEREVLGTEQVIGSEDESGRLRGMPLRFGERTIRLSGKIDRIDRLPDGRCAILDYKTGNAARFRSNRDYHLQHYLYTVAAETMLDTRIEEAGYLLLENGDDYLGIPEDAPSRARTAKVVDTLMRRLEDEKTAQEPAPCFRFSDDGIAPSEDAEERARALNSCAYWCEFAGVCPAQKKEASTDDDA